MAETTKQQSSAHQLATPVKKGPRLVRNNLKWDSLKGSIYEKYVEEGNTLPATMAYVEEEYGFKASPRKWKDKLKEWNFEKYVPMHDMEAIVAKERKRAIEGKETDFFYGGVEVKRQKIDNFKRRRRKNDLEAFPLSADTPPSVTYHTPLASNSEEILEESEEAIHPGEFEVGVTDHCENYMLCTQPQQGVELVRLMTDKNDPLQRGELLENDSSSFSSSAISKFRQDLPADDSESLSLDLPELMEDISIQETKQMTSSASQTCASPVLPPDENENEIQLECSRSNSKRMKEVNRGHKTTEISRLASSYEADGDWNAALLQYHLLAQCYIELEGRESKSAIQTLRRISEIYRAENRLAESARTYVQVLAGYKSLPGNFNEDIFETMDDLIEVLKEAGQYGEAQAVAQALVTTSRDLVEPERHSMYEAKLCDLNEFHKTAEKLFMASCSELASTLQDLGNCAISWDSPLYSLSGASIPKMREVSTFTNKLSPPGQSKKSRDLELTNIQRYSPEMLLDVIEVSVWFSKMSAAYLAESWFSTVISGLPLFGPEYRPMKVYGIFQYGLHCNRRGRWQEAIDLLMRAEEELGDIGGIDDNLGNLLLSPSRIGTDRENFPPSEDLLDPGQSLRDTIDRVLQSCREKVIIGPEAFSTESPFRWTGVVAPTETRRLVEEILSEYHKGRPSTITTTTNSCKYGVTFSGSEITGVSDSVFMVP